MDQSIAITPSSDKPSSRWPLIIVSFLTIFSLAASGWLFYQNLKLRQQISQLQTTASPTPLVSPKPSAQAETSNWKTYTNSELGYSLNYPGNLKVVSLKSDNSRAWGSLLSYTDIANDNFSLLRVDIYKLDKDNLLEWVKYHSSTSTPITQYFYAVKDIKQSNLNSYPSVEFVNDVGGQGETITRVITQDNYVYGISQISNIQHSKMYSESATLSDQILSTFKFTE